MRFLDLFAGIGGLSLGLERAGMTCVGHAEIDPYASRVLRKHWPDVPNLGDITKITEADLDRLGQIDLVCGGFPCQDLSCANTHGRRDKLAGSRSGLWFEMQRVVDAASPSWVLLENVSAAWRSWVPVVRRGLHRIGYASVPVRVRARDLGAPFEGARVFVVATTDRNGEPVGSVHAKARLLSQPATPRWQDWRKAPPRALGMADGVPCAVDRLRGTGNAVIPAMGEHVGRIIMESA